MKSIKIIKRKQDEVSNELKRSQSERSAEGSTREIATTIKSWIAELQERKRAQQHSSFDPSITATDPLSQNT